MLHEVVEPKSKLMWDETLKRTYELVWHEELKIWYSVYR
jgi:hypothetical protein